MADSGAGAGRRRQPQRAPFPAARVARRRARAVLQRVAARWSPRRPGWPSSIWRPGWSPACWPFGLVVALGVLGILTLWFFLIGLPVLVAALWLGLQLGRAERARFAVTLGAQIPAPPATLSPGTAGGGSGGC